MDGTKAYQQQYGFAYTDATGYFLISYAGDSNTTGAASVAAGPVPQLFVEVADTKANPVYLSSIAFQPVLGTASFQNIVLPAGGQPIGDPPEAIKKIALPQQPAQAQPGEPPQSSKT
jgi:hypothetical protein